MNQQSQPTWLGPDVIHQLKIASLIVDRTCHRRPRWNRCTTPQPAIATSGPAMPPNAKLHATVITNTCIINAIASSRAAPTAVPRFILTRLVQIFLVRLPADASSFESSAARKRGVNRSGGTFFSPTQFCIQVRTVRVRYSLYHGLGGWNDRCHRSCG